MKIVSVVNGEKHSEEHVAMDRWRRTGGRLVCYVCVSLLCGNTCLCMRKPGRLRASVELDALALVGTSAFGSLPLERLYCPSRVMSEVGGTSTLLSLGGDSKRGWRFDDCQWQSSAVSTCELVAYDRAQLQHDAQYEVNVVMGANLHH